MLRFGRPLILAFLVLLVRFSAAYGEPGDFQMVVLEKAQRIMVRSAPEIRRDTAITSYLAGIGFPYLGESGNWYQITLPSGAAAWVSRSVARIEVIPAPVRVVGDTVGAFAEPDPASPMIASLESGRVLNQVASGSGWVQVDLPGGRQGWMKGESLESLAPVAQDEAQPAPGQVTPGAAGVQAEPEAAAGESAPVDAGAGKSEEAVRAFRYALEVNPDDGLAHFELASQLESLGELEEALSHFRRAAELGEQPDEAMQRAAEISERLGEADQQVVPERAVAGSAAQAVPEEARSQGSFWQENQLSIVILAACLVGLCALFWHYRRRRVREIDRLLRLGQGLGGPGEPPSSSDFLRQLKEARGRQKEASDSLDRRFRELKTILSPSSGLAAEAEDEAHSKKVDELRQLIEGQQARINALSDLLSLQNEKIAAQEEEIGLLRELLPRKE